MRHAMARSMEECDDPRLVKMISDAIEERKATLGVA